MDARPLKCLSQRRIPTPAVNLTAQKPIRRRPPDGQGTSLQRAAADDGVGRPPIGSSSIRAPKARSASPQQCVQVGGPILVSSFERQGRRSVSTLEHDPPGAEDSKSNAAPAR
uniref:Uncharacterized protein n=1 Tax=Trichuris muris TaxID=70415 RepID=A0A5S6R5D9_TRIMR